MLLAHGVTWRQVAFQMSVIMTVILKRTACRWRSDDLIYIHLQKKILTYEIKKFHKLNEISGIRLISVSKQILSNNKSEQKKGFQKKDKQGYKAIKKIIIIF